MTAIRFVHRPAVAVNPPPRCVRVLLITPANRGWAERGKVYGVLVDDVVMEVLFVPQILGGGAYVWKLIHESHSKTRALYTTTELCRCLNQFQLSVNPVRHWKSDLTS